MKVKVEEMNKTICKTTRLSGGWYMAEPMTRSMAECMYDNLDRDELDELEVTGIDRDRFIKSCLDADHSAAFFAGPTLVFMGCANWVDLNGKRERLWDTMSTRFVREEGIVRAFVKHTPEMIDAFMLGEPTDSVIGICKSDFARSRKWIERVAKWKEDGYVGINNVWHTIYRYRSC